MYKRELTEKIIKSLSQNPAVIILGPRQIGKTTLAQHIAKEQRSIYLDLENPEHFQKLKDPAQYLELHADKLVILDEVQRCPDLFMSLRGIIDAGRGKGLDLAPRGARKNGRFLLLGSASNKLLKQSSESLAGRIHYCELSGLNPFEISSIHSEPNGETSGEPFKKLWMRGGFPESYVANNDAASYQWRQDFILTYLERHIPQLGPKIPASTLRRFWTMLAHMQGELLNQSKLANSLDVSSATINRYLDLMVDLLLLRKLDPLYGNVKKRLVKSPRIYIRDSGLAHALLRIPNYEALLGNPILGKSWEGFVIETIIGALPLHTNPFFYRTTGGGEIDLLIEFGIDEYWAVEIKASRRPTLKKGFHIACEDLKVKKKFVIYTGDDTFPSNHETIILSLPDFIEQLKKKTEQTQQS